VRTRWGDTIAPDPRSRSRAERDKRAASGPRTAEQLHIYCAHLHGAGALVAHARPSTPAPSPFPPPGSTRSRCCAR
jgi:hypothetical protein